MQDPKDPFPDIRFSQATIDAYIRTMPPEEVIECIRKAIEEKPIRPQGRP